MQDNAPPPQIVISVMTITQLRARGLCAHGVEVIVLARSHRPRAEGCMIDFFDAGYAAAELLPVNPVEGLITYLVKRGDLIRLPGGWFVSKAAVELCGRPLLSYPLAAARTGRPPTSPPRHRPLPGPADSRRARPVRAPSGRAGT